MTDDELKDFLYRVYEHSFYGNHSAAIELVGNQLEDMGVSLDHFI